MQASRNYEYLGEHQIKYEWKYSINATVKPLITNTSEEFIKCRLDNFSMSYTILRKFQYLQK